MLTMTEATYYATEYVELIETRAQLLHDLAVVDRQLETIRRVSPDAAAAGETVARLRAEAAAARNRGI